MRIGMVFFWSGS